MIKFLYSNSHMKTLKKIIDDASKYVVLSCSKWWNADTIKGYQNLSMDYSVLADVFFPLLRACNRGVRVILICESKYEHILTSFFSNEIVNQQLFIQTVESVNCKLYFNEQTTIITSKDIADEDTNHLGVVIDIDDKIKELEVYLEKNVITNPDIKDKLGSIYKGRRIL